MTPPSPPEWISSGLTPVSSAFQVWFQNARAKWRRNMISKDPKALAGGGGGEGGLGEGPAGEGSVGDYPDTPTVPPSAMSPDEGNSSQVSYQQMF